MTTSTSVRRRRIALPLLGLLVLALVAAIFPGSAPRRATAVVSSAPVAPSVGHSRPNIIVVMADDMRTDDLRFMPSVRRLLVGRGLNFRNSFSPYPLCCPARASFLTGRYAHNHHVYSHAKPYGFQSFDDHATIATALQQSGYQTGFVGKYLNGYGAERSLVTGGPSFRYVPAGWTDWYGIASALRDKKDWQGLLEHTTLWTDAEPNAGSAWAFQSIAYDGLGRYADAVQADLQTTSVAPDQVYGWMNLANDDFNVKDYAGAVTATRKAIEIDGSNAHAWNSLGAALQNTGKLDEAMDAYQHAVANDPHYAAAWENLGSQYYRKKQWDDAIKAWQTVLTIEPGNRVAGSGITNAQQMKALAQ